jgi:hypothetical protein
VPADLAEVSIDVTYPATAKHIAKATAQQFVMVRDFTSSAIRMYILKQPIISVFL